MDSKQILGLVVAIALLVVGGFSWRAGLFQTAQTFPDYTPDEADISGTKWMWEKTEMNDGTVTMPEKADAFTISFEKDGKLSGTTDCNSFFGTYAANQSALTLGPLGMTKMFCEGSQEMDFIRAVGDSNQFIFTSEDELVLLIKYDSGSVFFKRIKK